MRTFRGIEPHIVDAETTKRANSTPSPFPRTFSRKLRAYRSLPIQTGWKPVPRKSTFSRHSGEKQCVIILHPLRMIAGDPEAIEVSIFFWIPTPRLPQCPRRSERSRLGLCPHRKKRNRPKAKKAGRKSLRHRKRGKWKALCRFSHFCLDGLHL